MHKRKSSKEWIVSIDGEAGADIVDYRLVNDTLNHLTLQLKMSAPSNTRCIQESLKLNKVDVEDRETSSGTTLVHVCASHSAMVPHQLYDFEPDLIRWIACLPAGYYIQENF